VAFSWEKDVQFSRTRSQLSATFPLRRKVGKVPDGRLLGEDGNGVLLKGLSWRLHCLQFEITIWEVLLKLMALLRQNGMPRVKA
jgi:hypothetical protein